MPEDPYRNWDGQAGVPDLIGSPFVRQIISDHAELAEEPEVREAAKAALDAGTEAALYEFLETGLEAAQARAAARNAETARQNRVTIQAMAGTGGPIFNAEVQRVLAGGDIDREQFLAYGKTIATDRDAQLAAGAQARAEQLRARVTALLGAAGPHVKAAAQAALNAGDAAIADFLDTGYLAAAKRDADEREKQIRDQEAAQRAAEQLSDLAKRSARAMVARRNLVVAHGDALRALQRIANAMVLAGNEARKAKQILDANDAAGNHPPDSFSLVKAEVARQVGNARTAATDAVRAAEQATVQAGELVAVGLPYGTQWADMARGMSAAGQAAVLASETAQHTIDATEATDQARNAQERAEKHAEEARKWGEHAKKHELAAAEVAKAAQAQATAAKDAAIRAKQAREAAEAEANAAKAAADRTRAHREEAERQRDRAKAARRVAEAERANAAAARQRADQAAAEARRHRGEAQRQAGIAEDANRRAQNQEGIAGEAEQRAVTEEGKARQARDNAFTAERLKQTKQAKAEALEAAAAAARGTAAETDAKNAAIAARNEANTASSAAVAARDAANRATGAAVVAREAATEATRAAARARAAAQEARAAAAAANQAANRAESSAAETHHHATQANVKASEATAAETQAAEASRNAVQLAERAANEAMRALMAAERTRAEADAAFNESVSAATQADVALRASTAARSSSAAITDPANRAITVVAPYAGSDLDADFVILVANQARAVGTEQAQAARDRAAEAAAAADRAAQAARDAALEVKPAFEAAARAAASASAAASSAAEAQEAAARAASEGALARAAGERANAADAAARADAQTARAAANEANADAAIAGRSAAAAEREAQAARDAAGRAEEDARIARDAATAAERSATEARAAADRAEEHARNAAAAAERARQSAQEAQQAADRAEEQQRKDEEEARRKAAEEGGGGLPDLTQEELSMLLSTVFGRDLLGEYRAFAEQAKDGGSVSGFLIEIGAEVLLEVIGWRDAERCFGDGNIEACIWTVINIASFVAIVLKLPRVASAIVKIIQNISKFIDKSKWLREFVDSVKSFFNFFRKWCKRLSRAPATAKASSIPDFSCGLSDYRDDEGSMQWIALNARQESVGLDLRNVAVAYLPGWKSNSPDKRRFPDDYVVGISAGESRHSEKDIIEKVRAAGLNPKDIKALFTERQPCPDCENNWVAQMADDVKVSFSVTWTGKKDKNGNACKADQRSNLFLKAYLEVLFRARGIIGKAEIESAAEAGAAEAGKVPVAVGGGSGG